jgi:tryptophan 2,3-dioxygenase
MSDDSNSPVLPGAGASDYERYLRTDELLSLQKPAEDRVHRDELLFQTVHQSSELWLKLAVAEVREATRLLDADGLGEAARLLRRAVLCLQFVTSQLDMLDMLDPWDYQLIRQEALGHGSGFDSPGFRSVARVTPELGAAFERLLERSGIPLEDVYRSGDRSRLHELAELATDWDERLRQWRFRHYNIVARAIGEESIGIQGTPVQVLGKLVAQRQLPRLWEARSRLVDMFEAERRADDSES